MTGTAQYDLGPCFLRVGPISPNQAHKRSYLTEKIKINEAFLSGWSDSVFSMDGTTHLNVKLEDLPRMPEIVQPGGPPIKIEACFRLPNKRSYFYFTFPKARCVCFDIDKLESAMEIMPDKNGKTILMQEKEVPI